MSPDLEGRLGALVDYSGRSFPPTSVLKKPVLIFDVSRRKTNTWNQRGLDNFGPYDQFQFSPKDLNIAVICQAECQGRVEKFVEDWLYGDADAELTSFLKRFHLNKPYIRVFSCRDKASSSYRNAALAAVEHITDLGKKWNLAVVQIEESMKNLEGDANPYLATKALFLARHIPVQHVQLETINQPPRQRTFSVNNMGLATYAKLNGTPWLLPADQRVAHELVIGMGSYHQKASRFGAGDRYVGVTTLFSGDGLYLLESRTKSVPYQDYESALLQAVQTAVDNVRQDYNWRESDPVRLIFHSFKPLKNKEIDAVQGLMSQLSMPHAEFAFLHIAQDHPYLIFDKTANGVEVGRSVKGRFAPGRGQLVHLGRSRALLCLKGAKELKQSTDGHPAPILLNLHRASTFKDMTYLASQVFSFSCNSWRSFLPAPLPITILYSQLIAEQLTSLDAVKGWSPSLVVGQIGRSPWFL